MKDLLRIPVTDGVYVVLEVLETLSAYTFEEPIGKTVGLQINVSLRNRQSNPVPLGSWSPNYNMIRKAVRIMVGAGGYMSLKTCGTSPGEIATVEWVPENLSTFSAGVPQSWEKLD